MFKSFHHLVLTFLVANFFISGIEAIGCPPSWFMFQDKCYGLHTIPQTWNDAETDCQQYSKQSHLASVVSKLEREMIASHITINYKKSKGVWIGLYDSCSKKCWKWTDFSSIPFLSWDATFPRPRKYTSCIQLSASSESILLLCTPQNIEYRYVPVCFQKPDPGFKKWKNRNCSKKAEYLCMIRT